MIPADSADLGTPPAAGEPVTLTIDGKAVTTASGTSLMRAARLAGIEIPSLCATDSLEAFGSCRLCLVEIEGRPGTPASCTTPVAAGLVVRTRSERLDRLRRGVMELYLSDHAPDQISSEIAEQARAAGVESVRYPAGAGHVFDPVDASNPYFKFDPARCIVCSRCVRACDEVQGTLALTIAGRGFDSRVAASQDEPFLASECVSCGACVQACPTDALVEKSVLEVGPPEKAVVTTCGYCGVGCAFEVQMKGDTIGRMVPWKAGKANHGHSCVKGRFAYGYAHHRERVLRPMIRDKIDEPWREVSWEAAIAEAAARFKGIAAEHGRGALGAISSSRCTNEEAYLVQKLARAALRTNNIDTCARVCHSPTGYGLKTTFGTSAGTQDFDSVDEADVILVCGANPTDAHPVFASRMKRRLRAGAKLVVIDPRAIDLVRSPHIAAAHHLALRPGTNVAMLNALAHVAVTEGLIDEAFVRERCDWAAFQRWASFIAEPVNGPEAVDSITGVPSRTIRAAARLYAGARNGAIYYGLGVTEHSQGTTAVIALANLAMATGNLGRRGVGVNPLRGQNNVQGACDMGSFPHELTGYRHISDEAVRRQFEAAWGVHLDPEPGLRIPNMFDAALDGSFKGLYVQGEDILQSDPNTRHVAASLAAMHCIVVQDLFLNETAAFAHVFLPGSTFLEKDGTFTNAERRIQRVRKVIEPLNGYQDWEITQALSNALGYRMAYRHPSEIMAEIAATTPTFAGVTYETLDTLGSVQWPCNEAAPEGTPIMHEAAFVRGKGQFVLTEYIGTEEKVGPRFPLLLTTGRILSQYNVGAQTRRTDNLVWHEEDRLEIHPHDAEERGIVEGDLVKLASRAGETTLRALITERVAPGVVYTTFHHPMTQANVVTTEFSDWATSCPEYKVTAVQASRTNGSTAWQIESAARGRAAARVEAVPTACGDLRSPPGKLGWEGDRESMRRDR